MLDYIYNPYTIGVQVHIFQHRFIVGTVLVLISVEIKSFFKVNTYSTYPANECPKVLVFTLVFFKPFSPVVLLSLIHLYSLETKVQIIIR